MAERAANSCSENHLHILFQPKFAEVHYQRTMMHTYAAHTLQYNAIWSLKCDRDLWREVFFVSHPGMMLNWFIQKLTSFQGGGVCSFTVCQMIMQLVNKCVSVCLSIPSLCLISDLIKDMRIMTQSCQFSWNFAL